MQYKGTIKLSKHCQVNVSARVKHVLEVVIITTNYSYGIMAVEYTVQRLPAAPVEHASSFRFLVDH